MYNLFLSRNSHGYNPQLRFNLLKLDHILKSLINNQGIDRIFFENKYERMNFSLLTNLAQNCEKYKEFFGSELDRSRIKLISFLRYT